MCRVSNQLPSVRPSQSDDHRGIATPRSLTLGLEDGTWKMIDEKAAQEGVTADELIVFSVLYYLADADSGRISRRISRSPYRTLPEDRQRADADRGATVLSTQRLTDPS